MRRKQLAIGLLVSFFMLVAHAKAQKNELSGIIGRTFINDQVIQNSGSSDNKLRFGFGLTYEVNYARRLWTGPGFALSAEVPFVGNPDEDLHAALPNRIPPQYGSMFVTPAARVTAFPDRGVSFWLSLGGGFGHFHEDSSLLFGGHNPGPTGTNTGVLQAGVGLDVKLIHSLSLRGEGREFWSGAPQLDVNPGTNRNRNIFVGGGIVWHF